MCDGWISLHRKMQEWKWYKDVPVRNLFIHMLLIATHKNTDVDGVYLGVGQFTSGTRRLSEETGLTRQQIRTAIRKMESTQDIEVIATQKYTLYTVVNYEKYQNNVDIPTHLEERVATQCQKTENSNPPITHSNLKNATQHRNRNNDDKTNCCDYEDSMGNPHNLLSEKKEQPQNNNTINKNHNKNINNTICDFADAKSQTHLGINGSVIKLTKPKLEEWQEMYPHIDVKAELFSLDDYYAENNVKVWTPRAKAVLSKKNQAAKERKDLMIEEKARGDDEPEPGTTEWYSREADRQAAKRKRELEAQGIKVGVEEPIHGNG